MEQHLWLFNLIEISLAAILPIPNPLGLLAVALIKENGPYNKNPGEPGYSII